MGVLISAGCSYARAPVETKERVHQRGEFYAIRGNSYGQLVAEKYGMHFIDVTRDGNNNDTIVGSLIAGINLAKKTYPGHRVVALVGWSLISRLEVWWAADSRFVTAMPLHGGHGGDTKHPMFGMHTSFIKFWSPEYGWYRYQQAVQQAVLYARSQSVLLIQENNLEVFAAYPKVSVGKEVGTVFASSDVLSNIVGDQEAGDAISRMCGRPSWRERIMTREGYYDGSNHPTQLAHQEKALLISTEYDQQLKDYAK